MAATCLPLGQEKPTPSCSCTSSWSIPAPTSGRPPADPCRRAQAKMFFTPVGSPVYTSRYRPTWPPLRGHCNEIFPQNRKQISRRVTVKVRAGHSDLLSAHRSIFFMDYYCSNAHFGIFRFAHCSLTHKKPVVCSY